VDLERRQPVAVLQGRPAEALMKWLQAHASVAVLVHDRAAAYARAGRLAAPDVLQVADRFHLVRNVSEALKALLHSRRWPPPAPGSQRESSPQASATTPASPAEALCQAPQPTPRKRAVWEAVQQRRNLGQSLRQSARRRGWIAARWAGIWPRTSQRCSRRAVLDRLSCPPTWGTSPSAGPKAVTTLDGSLTSSFSVATRVRKAWGARSSSPGVCARRPGPQH
jgi:hypothetical protein